MPYPCHFEHLNCTMRAAIQSSSWYPSWRHRNEWKKQASTKERRRENIEAILISYQSNIFRMMSLAFFISPSYFAFWVFPKSLRPHSRQFLRCWMFRKRRKKKSDREVFTSFTSSPSVHTSCFLLPFLMSTLEWMIFFGVLKCLINLRSVYLLAFGIYYEQWQFGMLACGWHIGSTISMARLSTKSIACCFAQKRVSWWLFNRSARRLSCLRIYGREAWPKRERNPKQKLKNDLTDKSLCESLLMAQSGDFYQFPCRLLPERPRLWKVLINFTTLYKEAIIFVAELGQIFGVYLSKL